LGKKTVRCLWGRVLVGKKRQLAEVFPKWGGKEKRPRREFPPKRIIV